MKSLIVSVLAAATLAAAPAAQKFTGIISDSMCPTGSHAQMQMGPTDRECALACVDVHGAVFVLVAGKNVYTLSDQKTSLQFAGQKVIVTGTLDAKTHTIKTQSISAAK